MLRVINGKEESPGFSDKKITWLLAGALLALTGWAFWLRWHALTRESGLSSVDGYYYAIQMRSLLATHALYYRASPLAFWLLLPFVALKGPIVGVKLGAAFWSVLTIAPAFWLTRRITGCAFMGLLSATLLAVSLQQFVLTQEFVKQDVGVTLVVFALVALLVVANRQPGQSRTGVMMSAALLSAGVFATHKAAFGLLLLFVAPPIVVHLLSVTALERRRHIGWVIAGILLIPLGWAALPGRTLSLADRGLLRDLFVPLRERETMGGIRAESFLAATCGALWVAAILWRQIKQRAEDRREESGQLRHMIPFLMGPLLLAAIAGCPWLNTDDGAGLGRRLATLGFLPLAILAPALIGQLLAARSQRTRGLVTGILIIAILLFVPRPEFTGWLQTPEKLLSALQSLRGRLPAGALLILKDHRNAFIATWVTGCEATFRPPAAPDPTRSFRVILGSDFPPGSAPIVENFIVGQRPGAGAAFRPWPVHPKWLTVFPEQAWQAFLAAQPEKERCGMNPWCATSAESLTPF